MSDEYAESLKHLSNEVNQVTGKKSSQTSFMSIDIDGLITGPYIYGIIIIFVIILLILIKPKIVTYQESKYQYKISVMKLMKWTMIISLILCGIFYFWRRRNQRKI